jgi:preprotein translocase subunit Sss1
MTQVLMLGLFVVALVGMIVYVMMRGTDDDS